MLDERRADLRRANESWNDANDRRPRRLFERLARFRVAIGFAFGALVFWLAEPTRLSLAAGAAIACVGELIRVWAAGHLNKAREVTASGPYRWVAHPLYVGSSVMGAGLAVASRSLVVASLIGLYLMVGLTIAAKTEEAFLDRTFGDEYTRYRRGAASPMSSQRFSAARALANHEHRALMGLLLAVLLLTLKLVFHV